MTTRTDAASLHEKHGVLLVSKRLQQQLAYTSVPNEIIEHPRLSMQAKMIWIDLWKFAHFNKDKVFPGMKRLESDLGVSENTIRKYRRELEQEHLLVVTQRGLQMTNIYTLYAPDDCVDDDDEKTDGSNTDPDGVTANEGGENSETNAEPHECAGQEPHTVADKEEKNIRRIKEQDKRPRTRDFQSLLRGFTAYEEISVEEKAEALLNRNSELKHTQRVGYLTDVILGLPNRPKKNAGGFVIAVGNKGELYKTIAHMLTKYPLDFLVEWLQNMTNIPWKKGVDKWKNYLFGAAVRQYPLWFVSSEAEKGRKRNERVVKMIGSIESSEMKEIFGGKLK